MPEREMMARTQPETLRLHEVSASFTAGDLAASLAWYETVVGFTVQERYENEDGSLGGAVLVAGAVKLFLAQDDFAKGRDRAKGVGMRLWCVTSQDIDGLAAAVQARGGELDQPVQDRPWGTRDFGLVDPDGFHLTISSPMPAAN